MIEDCAGCGWRQQEQRRCGVWITMSRRMMRDGICRAWATVERVRQLVAETRDYAEERAER